MRASRAQYLSIMGLRAELVEVGKLWSEPLLAPSGGSLPYTYYRDDVAQANGAMTGLYQV